MTDNTDWKMTAEAAEETIKRVWNALGVSTFEQAGGLSISEIVEQQRGALLNLANAADAVGVRFFDTDTMEPEVEAMQTATQAARAALK